MVQDESVTILDPSDPAEAVAAALACDFCLSADVSWKLVHGEDPHAACRCGACGRERVLWLTAEQALRVALHARSAAWPRALRPPPMLLAF